MHVTFSFLPNQSNSIFRLYSQEDMKMTRKLTIIWRQLWEQVLPHNLYWFQRDFNTFSLCHFLVFEFLCLRAVTFTLGKWKKQSDAHRAALSSHIIFLCGFQSFFFCWTFINYSVFSRSCCTSLGKTGFLQHLSLLHNGFMTFRGTNSKISAVTGL